MEKLAMERAKGTRPSGVAEIAAQRASALFRSGGLDDRPLTAPGRIRPQRVRRTSKRAKVSRALSGGLPGKLEELRAFRKEFLDELYAPTLAGFGSRPQVGRFIDTLPESSAMVDTGDGDGGAQPNAASKFAEVAAFNEGIERGLAHLPKGRLKDTLRELARWPGKVPEVDLSTTDLSRSESVTMLAQYVNANGGVVRLLLAHCRLSTASVLILASALHELRTLRVLDLRYNPLSSDGGKTLATAMISHGELAQLGVGSVMIPLERLRSGELTELRLRGCNLGSGETIVVAGALRMACAVTFVDLSGNYLVPELSKAERRRQRQREADAREEMLAQLGANQRGSNGDDSPPQPPPPPPPPPRYDFAGIRALAESLRDSPIVETALLSRCMLPVRALKGQTGDSALNFYRSYLSIGDEIVIAKLLERDAFKACRRRGDLLATFSSGAGHTKKVTTGVRTKKTTLVRVSALLGTTLAANQITEYGARALAVALRSNKTLVSLDLCGNKLGPPGLRQLAHGLAHGATLTELDVSRNRLGEEGGIVLGDILRENISIVALRCRANDLGGRGLVPMLGALAPQRDNATLTSLDLRDNAGGDMAAFALAASLRAEVLSAVLSSGNDFTKDGKVAIGEALLACSHASGFTFECDEWMLSTSVAHFSPGRLELREYDLTMLAGVLRRNATLYELDLSENLLCGVEGYSTALHATGNKSGRRSGMRVQYLRAQQGTSYGLYTPSGFESFTMAMRPTALGARLETLSLDFCGLGRGGLAAVACIGRAVTFEAAPRLRSLSLAGNAIGPAPCNGHDTSAVVLLAKVFRAHPRLRRLELAANALGDVGVTHFAAAFTTHPSLLYLGLAANGISAAGAKALARCLIHHSGANVGKGVEPPPPARPTPSGKLGVVDLSNNDVLSSGGEPILSFVQARCGYTVDYGVRRTLPDSVRNDGGVLADAELYGGFDGKGAAIGSAAAGDGGATLLLKGLGWFALVLQTAWRASVQRWRHNAMMTRRRDLATLIATCWRGFDERRRFVARKAQHKLDVLRSSASTAVQTIWRRYQATKQLLQRQMLYAERIERFYTGMRDVLGAAHIAMSEGGGHEDNDDEKVEDDEGDGGFMANRCRKLRATRLLSQDMGGMGVLGVAAKAAARTVAAGGSSLDMARAAVTAAAQEGLTSGNLSAAEAGLRAAEAAKALDLLPPDGASAEDVEAATRAVVLAAAQAVVRGGGDPAAAAAAAAAAAEALGTHQTEVVALAALAAATAAMGGFDERVCKRSGVGTGDGAPEVGSAAWQARAEAAGVAAALAAAAAGAGDEAAARAAISAASEAVLSALAAPGKLTGHNSAQRAQLEMSDEIERAVLRAAGKAAAAAAQVLVGPADAVETLMTGTDGKVLCSGGPLLKLPGFGVKAVARLAAEAAADGAAKVHGFAVPDAAGAIAGHAALAAGATLSDMARFAGAAAAHAAASSGSGMTTVSAAAGRAAALAVLAAGGTSKDATNAAEKAAVAAVNGILAAQAAKSGKCMRDVAALTAAATRAARGLAESLARSELGAALAQECAALGAAPPRRTYQHADALRTKKKAAKEKAEADFVAARAAEAARLAADEAAITESQALAMAASAHAGGVGSGEMVAGVDVIVNAHGQKSTRPNMFSLERQDELADALGHEAFGI